MSTEARFTEGWQQQPDSFEQSAINRRRILIAQPLTPDEEETLRRLLRHGAGGQITASALATIDQLRQQLADAQAEIQRLQQRQDAA